MNITDLKVGDTFVKKPGVLPRTDIDMLFKQFSRHSRVFFDNENFLVLWKEEHHAYHMRLVVLSERTGCVYDWEISISAEFAKNFEKHFRVT